MKKVFVSICVALMGLGAFAQEKGDMAAGLNLGVAPFLESGVPVTNFGIGAKFQYNITNPIRLEADIDYWLKAKGMDVFDISVNGQYLFHCAEKLTVYPLVGIGYAHLGGGMSGDFGDIMDDLKGLMGKNGWDDDEVEGSSSTSRFLFNVGVGAEYALTSKIAVGAEIKYQYIKDFSRLPITIGVTYKF